VARIAVYGSRKPVLQEQALAIFTVCVNLQITLEPEWIPRNENEFADNLCRVSDGDDWMLCFKILMQGGAHTQWIHLLMCAIAKWSDLTPGTGILAQKLSTPSLVIGVERIIGGVHHSTWCPGCMLQKPQRRKGH